MVNLLSSAKLCYADVNRYRHLPKQSDEWYIERFLECCRCNCWDIPDIHYTKQLVGTKKPVLNIRNVLGRHSYIYFPNFKWSWDHHGPNVHPPLDVHEFFTEFLCLLYQHNILRFEDILVFSCLLDFLASLGMWCLMKASFRGARVVILFFVHSINWGFLNSQWISYY